MDEKICTHCVDFKNCEASVALGASKMAVSFVNKMKKGGKNEKSKSNSRNN